MDIGEVLKFYVKLLPLAISVTVIFLYLFPTFSLTLEEFSFIYWGISVIAFPINYKVQRWTEYAIKNYGAQVEENPIMRRMYIKGSLRLYWITWLCAYVFLSILYILAIYSRSLFYLIVPLLLIVSVLYDFFNDFYWLRKFKNRKFALELHFIRTPNCLIIFKNTPSKSQILLSIWFHNDKQLLG